MCYDYQHDVNSLSSLPFWIQAKENTSHAYPINLLANNSNVGILQYVSTQVSSVYFYYIYVNL